MKQVKSWRKNILSKFRVCTTSSRPEKNRKPKFQNLSFSGEGSGRGTNFVARCVTDGKFFSPKSCFYLPHMKYGKVLISRREKWKFFIADFHVLGLFIPKKHDLSEKKISVCHAPLPVPLLDEIWDARIPAPSKARMLKFWLPESFWPTWCTSYSEFWNSES